MNRNCRQDLEIAKRRASHDELRLDKICETGKRTTMPFAALRGLRDAAKNVDERGGAGAPKCAGPAGKKP